MGGSLLDKASWKVVGKEMGFVDYVTQGDATTGMPAFDDILSRAEIRSLEIYIDEERQLAADEPDISREGVIYEAGGYTFQLETVVEGVEAPWSIAFLPEGSLLITEKTGDLLLVSETGNRQVVEGIPEAWVHGQGGLMEVALHPDYEQNGWVYLAYSASHGREGTNRTGMTRIVRGRIADQRWVDEETIFEAAKKYHSTSGGHFGTRLAFQDGYLFFSVGDRRADELAQDLSTPNGKIHRIHDDGRIPADNPFAEEGDHFPSTWSYGNRNAQGLDFHPVSGALWESEHGPRGGDEINRIERGANYGWPVITYGMNYNGTPITDQTSAPGMEQPAHYWTPSIAVCGIDFYEGDAFPEWKYDLFAGGLKSNQLHRIEIEDGEVVSDTIILKGEGEVRDVASGPDGYLYLVLDAPGRIVRLIPAGRQAALN